MHLVYHIARTLCFIFFRLFYDVRVEGEENVPDTGCLIVANHASFLDPPLVGAFITKEPIHYLARKSLFRPPVMDKLLPLVNSVPVDQDRPDMAGTKKIISLLRAGEKVLVFPEGTRTEDGKLQPGQPGIGLVIAKAQVPVLPVHVSGTYAAWPTEGKWKFFLPMRVSIGKPIVFTTPHHPTREDYQRISDEVMQAIAALA
ncbi:MAG: lysophospholipid acyltransferase family protein [bacterium]